MKTLLLSVLSMILVSTFSFAQDAKEEATPVNNKKAPEITFEKIEYDFGTLKYGADATCDFVFKNTGKTPLILTNVRSSCGCTIPSWTKTPIAKKKSDKITVKYNTHKIGNFHKTITVTSNAKNSPIVLTIKGKVLSAKEVEEQNTTPPQEKSNTINN